ncbi:hypothetical protein B0A50_07419 [Salinomyces thailandicus]|uniref:N-acetylgalactosaminide beta-1,3-galactosyltransferase n=1 Tax=Salinomyces thailandicus TaxID=706561 RepID=A0A4U0TPC7_9PEZI|nr:hypothetical protein B0A50_07419 [Salinomyces thailandica]
MSAASTSLSRGVITLPRIATLSVLLLALLVFRDVWLPVQSPYRSHTQPSSTTLPHTESEVDIHRGDGKHVLNGTASESCMDIPGADNIMVLLKTGATELYQKLPTHIVTTLGTCVPHFMIFSDLAQNFADIPIHDAIAPVSKSFREHHEDFELYRKLQQYQSEGQDMHRLSGGGSWNLDKWKFLPMLHQAFESAGDNIEWFFLMEADTSVSWTNLLQWLRTMDPQNPFYLGAQNVIGDTVFAHGGSGVVISRRAADMLTHKRTQMGKAAYDEEWEESTSTSCCGDEIMARAFAQVDVPLTPSWPLIQGETVSSIDWKEDHWCTVALTWHHVTPIEVDAMFQFEMAWVDEHGWDTPYLFRDVHNYFISRHITVNRTSWNNLSKDHKFISPDLSTDDKATAKKEFAKFKMFEQKSVASQDACAAACQRHKSCVQWMHTPGRCYLGNVMRFGKSDERDSEHWVSGWMNERIESFAEKLAGCRTRWHG